MTDEMERIWKELVVAVLWYYPSIYLEGMRKITAKKSARVPAVLLVFELGTSQVPM
jgi:hypothetical protein